MGARERLSVEGLLAMPLVGHGAQQQPRKRPKSEPDALARRLSMLEKEVEGARRALQEPADDKQQQAREVAEQCAAARRRAEALASKLEQHEAWMQQVNALMVAAPLLDLASSSDEEEKERAGDRGEKAGKRDGKRDGRESLIEEEQEETKAPQTKAKDAVHADVTLSYVNAWRRSKPEQQLPHFVVAEHLKVISARASKRAAWMLNSYETAQRAFPLQAESRNWHVATGSTIDKSIIFRCERTFTAASLCQIDKMANEMWRTVVCDEVLRTFVPIVQDSVLEHADVTRCLWRQTIELNAATAPCSVTTVGCLDDCSGESRAWQLSIESIRDSYLSLVADQSAAKDSTGTSTFSLRPNSPPEVPPASRNLSTLQIGTANDFVVGIHLTESNGGVKLLIVGTGTFDAQHYRDPTVELLQYLVTVLPIYDELYLRQFDAP